MFPVKPDVCMCCGFILNNEFLRASVCVFSLNLFMTDPGKTAGQNVDDEGVKRCTKN